VVWCCCLVLAHGARRPQWKLQVPLPDDVFIVLQI
jgi:hypothetical protein